MSDVILVRGANGGRRLVMRGWGWYLCGGLPSSGQASTVHLRHGLIARASPRPPRSPFVFLISVPTNVCDSPSHRFQNLWHFPMTSCLTPVDRLDVASLCSDSCISPYEWWFGPRVSNYYLVCRPHKTAFNTILGLTRFNHCYFSLMKGLI